MGGKVRIWPTAEDRRRQTALEGRKAGQPGALAGLWEGIFFRRPWGKGLPFPESQSLGVSH